MDYVNNKQMNPNHWTNDLEVGGGRIVSDACHFIDLSIFIAQSRVVSVSADCALNHNNSDNTVSINLKFLNGSIASINYFSNGNEKLER